MSTMSWLIDDYVVTIAEDQIAISTEDDEVIPPEDADALRQFILYAIQEPSLQQVMLDNDEEEVYDTFVAFVRDRQLEYSAAVISFVCEGCGRRREGLLKDSPTRIESGQRLCRKCLQEIRSS